MYPVESEIIVLKKIRGARFSATSRPALGLNQPPVQLLPVFLRVKCCLGVLLTTHPLLVPSPWKSNAKPLTTLCATTGPEQGHITLCYSATGIMILHSG